MQRDKLDVRSGVEDILCPVAVMHIQIEDGYTRASAVQAVLRGNGGVVEKTIACGPVDIGVVTVRTAQSVADGCFVQHGSGKGSLRRSIGCPPRSGVDRAGHITHVKSGLPHNRGGIARLWRNRKRIGDHFGRSIVQRAPAGMGLSQKAQATIRVDPGNRFQPEVPRGRDRKSRPFQRVSQVQGAFGLFAVLVRATPDQKGLGPTLQMPFIRKDPHRSTCFCRHLLQRVACRLDRAVDVPLRVDQTTEVVQDLVAGEEYALIPHLL